MLGPNRWLCYFAFAALLAACGSKNDPAPGGQSNTPAPQIVTTSVKEALANELYSQPLAATGGSAPLAWSLPTEPKEIPWLTINSSSGALSGTPTEALAPGKSFVVRVKDHDGRSDQKTFTLVVRECTAQSEGATFPCHVPGVDSCIAGTRTCSGGQLGDCTAGSGSTSTDYCGPGCLACGTSANVCDGGHCQCGANDPCGTADTTKPDCCTEASGSVCTNRQSDPKHCGDCDTVCDKESVHVVPTCAGGACVSPAPCQPGYARCPLGSNVQSCLTETASDPNNCGGCGNKCPTATDLAGMHATPAGTACQGGQCKIACTDGAQNCNGQLADGCECLPPIDGSASCGGDGKTCTPVCAAGGKTVLCRIPSINGRAPTCVSPLDYVQCIPGDPSSCVPNGTETRNGPGTQVIQIDNCGRCGNTCNAPPDAGGKVSCNHGSGACTQGCDPIDENNASWRALCNGRCVSLISDRNNCGACGSYCPATVTNGTAQCSFGSCVLSCGSTTAYVCDCGEGGCTNCMTAIVPFASCDGSLGNGCETRLDTDANCGACGSPCTGSYHCKYSCTHTGGREDTCTAWAWTCVDTNGGGGGQ